MLGIFLYTYDGECVHSMLPTKVYNIIKKNFGILKIKQMTLGHISTIDLSPFQSFIPKNIEFSESFLSQMTFVGFNMNYETYVKIHKTNNKVYIRYSIWWLMWFTIIYGCNVSLLSIMDEVHPSKSKFIYKLDKKISIIFFHPWYIRLGRRCFKRFFWWRALWKISQPSPINKLS